MDPVRFVYVWLHLATTCHAAIGRHIGNWRIQCHMIPVLNQAGLKPDIPKGYITSHGEGFPGIIVTELSSPGKQKFPLSPVLACLEAAGAQPCRAACRAPVLPFQSSHQTATGTCPRHCWPLQNQLSASVFLSHEIQWALWNVQWLHGPCLPAVKISQS